MNRIKTGFFEDYGSLIIAFLLALSIVILGGYLIAEAGNANRWRYDDNGDGIVGPSDTWQTKPIRFMWEDTNPADVISYWILRRSDTPGGPYTKEAAKILFTELNEDQTYTAPVGFEVGGDPNTVVQKYYVLVACNASDNCSDDPKEGETEPNALGWSNEVTAQFSIPAISRPFTLIIGLQQDDTQ